MSLRKQLIRLASKKPHLRPHLLPLLREAAFSLGPADKKVLDAFIDKRALDSKKLSTDGKRLDGLWMGGGNVAEWSGNKIQFNDTGGKSGDTIHRAIKKMAPRNAIASQRTARRRTELSDVLDDLVQSAAESEGLEDARDAYATREVEREADKFEAAAYKALDDWVNRNRFDYMNMGTMTDDLWDESGAYLIFMTLAGEGVGIFDGDWNHFFADRGRKSLKDLERFLKGKLSRYVDDTGGGSLNDAISNAAYETGGGEEDEDY